VLPGTAAQNYLDYPAKPVWMSVVIGSSCPWQHALCGFYIGMISFGGNSPYGVSVTIDGGCAGEGRII